MKPAHVRQLPLRMWAMRDQLCANRYRDFFWSNSPNIQTYRRMDPFEQISRNSFLSQFAENGNRLPLRPNHTDIPRWSLHCPAQNTHIVTMPACKDHNIRGFAESQPRHDFIEVIRNHFLRARKAFSIGISLTVIHNGHIKPSVAGHFVKVERHMPRAK